MVLLYLEQVLVIRILNKKIRLCFSWCSFSSKSEKKNFLSISQLTSQFPVNCESSDVDFCVKEWKTRHPLITGKRKGDLYVLSNVPEAHFSYWFKSGTIDVWHQRLGHPQALVVSLLKNRRLIDVIGPLRTKH
jgi:hypothetical protein